MATLSQPALTAPPKASLLVISPHLDDAVFGCADAIVAYPGAVVATVFAGEREACGEATPWDTASGFGPHDNAVACRRGEDRAALRVLEAHPCWLPFLDRQYASPPSAEEIRQALDAALACVDPEVVMLPLGLWHDDHRLTHDAAIPLVRAHRHLAWVAYEDAIYRRFHDGGLEERLAGLRAAGIRPAQLGPGLPASELKRRSVTCYRSQLRALTGDGRRGADDALEPEGHWALIVD